MRRMILILICLILTSCGIFQYDSYSDRACDISRERTYLSLEIIQTLSKTEALAWTEKHDVVKIETKTDIYYDGKKIIGNFIFKDTYTYTNNEDIVKTVPVYMRTDDSVCSRLGERMRLSVRIIQTLSKNEALACTEDFKVVKLETNSEIYYDGKQVAGTFRLAGTYQYTNRKGILKTVPVYIRTSEYVK